MQVVIQGGRVKLVLKISFIFLFLNFLSCSYLQKVKDKVQGHNQIVGVGSQDIENTDIDSDRRGSDSGSISGLKTIFFSIDSSSLSPKAKKILKANKNWADRNSKVLRLELEGHCDSLGSEAYNIGLGQRRAESVQRFLKSLGVGEDKLSIISYGEERPLSSAKNHLNRRVNFVPIY